MAMPDASSLENGRKGRVALGTTLIGVSLLAWIGLTVEALGLEVVNLAIPAKSFQMVVFPLAQERGYMQEEGIDLKIILVNPVTSIQGMVAGDIHFSMAGGSALAALVRGVAAQKLILAMNNRVLLWLLSKPEITSIKALKGKRIATLGLGSLPTAILKEILIKNGLDPTRDVTLLDTGAGNQVRPLVAGVADAAVATGEQRYFGLDAGMRELSDFGKEVKESWGLLATTDRMIKERPKVVGAFIKATLKAMRLVHQDRATAIASMTKFSGLKRDLVVRIYDDLNQTFTRDGIVDEEAQKNDIDMTRAATGVTKQITNQQAYDFSFAREADRQLTQAGWHP
jgi:NitT/TauT family transport system substrate-binding protein